MAEVINKTYTESLSKPYWLVENTNKIIINDKEYIIIFGGNSNFDKKVHCSPLWNGEFPGVEFQEKNRTHFRNVDQIKWILQDIHKPITKKKIKL